MGSREEEGRRGVCSRGGGRRAGGGGQAGPEWGGGLGISQGPGLAQGDPALLALRWASPVGQQVLKKEPSGGWFPFVLSGTWPEQR